MKITIDFETLDYGIREGLGPGWPWGGCRILGCGIKIEDGDTYYETDVTKITEICEKATTIIAHNAQYEAGVLKMLGIDIKNKTIRCTKLGAKLFNNLIPDLSLEGLSQRFLGEGKESNKLLEVGHELGIFQLPEWYEDPEFYVGGDIKFAKKLKTTRSKMMNLVWENLDKIQAGSSVVADYCIKDVDLTHKLDEIWMEEVGEKIYEYYCKLINVATDMRGKGIRVDIKATYALRAAIEEELRPLERNLWEEFGVFNYNSPAQVKLWAYNQLGVRGIKGDDGKESFGKEWINANQDCKPIEKLGKIKKLDKMISFCKTIIEHEKNGRIYPQLNIMQARTGRFSCVTPNVQQIPAGKGGLSDKVRTLFLPEEGEKWCSLDFSSQEPRLQIHYAEAIGSENGHMLAEKYRLSPSMDLYTEVCSLVNDMTGIEITRKDSKIMTLALSYGMGKDKGAKALGVSVTKYQEVRKAYFKGASYLKELNTFCQERIREKGFLLTIGGRKTYNEIGYEYKALNSLIQGGAFDQTAAALIEAYDKGIVPLNTVHDEINISVSDKKEAKELQNIMENCININVPSVAEIGLGDNWAEAK